VKITPDGVVKVLDFGLAKAAAGDQSSPDLTQAPTITMSGTRDGIILGTPAYMSPEQARGKPVDKRTDIWAFGCVLYEMLSGHRTFGGDTISDTIAAIIEREPTWDRLPDRTPPAVRHVLRRCLEKDPRRRLRDIGDARAELEEALVNPAQEDRAPKAAGVTRRAAINTLVGAAAGAAVTGAFAVSRYRGDATPRNLARFAVPLGEGEVVSASFNKVIAISPDGAYLACNVQRQGQPRLLSRPLGELAMKPVAEGARGVPFFSPDGRWLGYFATDAPYRLRKVALSGGAPVTICNSENFAGATWAADDTIYFVATTPGGLVRVPAAGGEPAEVLNIDFENGERLHKYPHALPGGAGVLFTIATVDTESFDDAQIAAFSSRTGQRKVLVEGGTHPRYSASGHLLYGRNGNLLAVRFDPDRLEVTGQPFTVLEGVLMSRNTGVANFDISANGDLDLHPRISPEGRKLAIEIEGSNHDVFVYDFANGVLSNITTDGRESLAGLVARGQQDWVSIGTHGTFSVVARPCRQEPAGGARAGHGLFAERGVVVSRWTCDCVYRSGSWRSSQDRDRGVGRRPHAAAAREQRTPSGHGVFTANRRGARLGGRVDAAVPAGPEGFRRKPQTVAATAKALRL
jgi:hypothetical protein